MRTVAFSDTHLVYSDTRSEEIVSFFDWVARNPPDELVMVGDVWELWRGDNAGAYVRSLGEGGALDAAVDAADETVFVVGNHDYWLLHHTSNVVGEYPFDPRREYETNYDGTPVRFLHGDRFDAPVYNPLTNDLLAAADDRLSYAGDRFWEFISTITPPMPTPGPLRPPESFSNPNAIRDQPERIATIEDRIETYKDDDEWAIFGHTHTPRLDDDRMLANCGSWTIDRATYIEIVDGTVHLREWNG